MSAVIGAAVVALGLFLMKGLNSPLPGVLMVTYALMNADLSVILMLVGAYLLIVACCIGFTVHYNKTM